MGHAFSECTYNIKALQLAVADGKIEKKSVDDLGTQEQTLEVSRKYSCGEEINGILDTRQLQIKE